MPHARPHVPAILLLVPVGLVVGSVAVVCIHQAGRASDTCVHYLCLQVLLLASVALAIGSLAVVAVPKLAGQLIDVCITYDKGGVSRRDAMHRLNNMLYEILGVLAIGGVASGFRSW